MYFNFFKFLHTATLVTTYNAFSGLEKQPQKSSEGSKFHLNETYVYFEDLPQVGLIQLGVFFYFFSIWYTFLLIQYNGSEFGKTKQGSLSQSDPVLGHSSQSRDTLEISAPCNIVSI